jgi:ketosteroid isomerase-like protein
MADGNVELVRSILAAWERGDWGAVDWADPAIEYVMVDEPGSRPHTGVSAMRETWRTFLSAWEGYRLEADEYRALDDGRVLVLLRAFGRGKSSGLDLAEATRGRRGANVFDIRGGKVTRLATYFDERRALADLGLAE